MIYKIKYDCRSLSNDLFRNLFSFQINSICPILDWTRILSRTNKNGSLLIRFRFRSRVYYIVK